MTPTIASARLHNQHISQPGPSDPVRIVSWLTAVQAQEFEYAKWGVALRTHRLTNADVQCAFDAGKILRTHVLRPTWHFVTPADIRWMLELSVRSVHQRMAPYDRRLGLTTQVMHRAIRVFEKVLGEGEFLTRAELRQHLERSGLPHKTYNFSHMALYAEAEGVLTSGPRLGKQFTYALLSLRAPNARSLPREEALAELALRFLRSRGPCTTRDFSWWSGLNAADSKRAFEMNDPRKLVVDGLTYWTLGRKTVRSAESTVQLLPIYDEYLVSYRDRIAVRRGAKPRLAGGGYGTFQNSLVIGGQMAGTWRTDGKAGAVRVIPARRLRIEEQALVRHEVSRYERFRNA